ncbi:MAG: signal peptidase II [Clostridia bacterium]|nr:signal peptidase II [Clostridia bacterium]
MMLACFLAAMVIIIDQLTKMCVLSSMELSQSIQVIKDVLHITYVQNKGMAFGLFANNRMLFMIPTVILIAVIIFTIVKFGRKNKLLDMAMGLVLGGGIGNMIDRIARGYVVDFVDFCAFDFWQWVFNVADAAVVVGAFMFVLAMLTDKKLFVDEKMESGEENE